MLKTPTPAPPATWIPAFWTTLLLFGIYLLTTGGETFISDGEIMLMTTMRIVDHGVMTLPTPLAESFPQTIQGQGGFYFSRYGLGQSLAAVPFYWFGSRILPWLFPEATPHITGRFCALLLPAFATAVTAGVLCLWASRLYASAAMGVSIALLYGIGTFAWPFSRVFFSEPLFTCCLIIAAFALHQRWPLVAGLAYGYAAATRMDAIFVFPALLLLLWYRTGDRPIPKAPPFTDENAVRWPIGSRSWEGMRSLLLISYPTRNRMIALVQFGLGTLPGLMIILLNNWFRFRTLRGHGYDDQWFTGNLIEGMMGLLFSPGKSPFLYSPLLLVVPIAFFFFARRFRVETWFLVLLILLTLWKSATWWIWWGGWSWGPRFLVPLLPFLVLTIGVLLERRAWVWLIVGLLLPLSILVNLLGIVVNFNTYLQLVTSGIFDNERIYLYEWYYSPIPGHLRILDWSQVPIVSFHLSRPDIGFSEPGATIISFGFVLLTLAGAIGLIRSLWRPTWQPSQDIGAEPEYRY